MTKIKLCGMMRPQDIEVTNLVKPEYAGFIFWDKSFRNLSFSEAKALKLILDPSIKAVGVFVDAAIESIVELVEHKIIDVIQLHGSEDEEYLKKLKARIPEKIEIIKAFKVTNKEEVERAVSFASDYILFDPGKGSGNTFNWELIKDVKRPYFLAGGLNIENIEEAILKLNPYAVDVSSGIETDKKKDPDKMKKFVSIVRSETE